MAAADGGSRDRFQDVVASYLEIEVVDAAALVTTEGLLIAEAGDADCDLESLGALAAPVLSIACELANELGESEPRLLSLSLPENGIILAPLGSDIFLMLMGGIPLLAYGFDGAIRL